MNAFPLAIAFDYVEFLWPNFVQTKKFSKPKTIHSTFYPCHTTIPENNVRERIHSHGFDNRLKYAKQYT